MVGFDSASEFVSASAFFELLSAFDLASSAEAVLELGLEPVIVVVVFALVFVAVFELEVVLAIEQGTD